MKRHHLLFHILSFISILLLLLIQLQAITAQCDIDPEHYISNQYPPADRTFPLSNNQSIYFGFKVPNDWIKDLTVHPVVQIARSIPTVLVRLDYDNVQCSSGKNPVKVQPILRLGAKTVDTTAELAVRTTTTPTSQGQNQSCQIRWLRSVRNMTTSYWDVDRTVHTQYIAIYPSDIIQMVTEADTPVGTTPIEFVFDVSQSNCDKNAFSIHASYVTEVDLNSKGILPISLFPFMRHHFKFSVDQSVGSNRILLGSLQTNPPQYPVQFHMRMNDYPNGSKTLDQEFTFGSMAVAPLPMNSVFYFYVEPQDSSPESSGGGYVQNMVSINILFSKGRLCESGCGQYGYCNMTVGECICRTDLGYHGVDCSIVGCVEGEDCTVPDVGRGQRQCKGPDVSASTCRIDECSKPLHMVDLRTNSCVRMFPDSVFFGVFGATAAVMSILGFSLALGLCRLCSKQFQRRHYHYLE